MLDVLMICRNNSEYFTHIFPTIKKELDYFDVNWYIYENNSSDSTPLILKMLATENPNLHIITEKTVRYQNKYLNIYLAREKLTTWYRENIKNNRDIIWLDTNIIFNQNTISKLLESRDRNPQACMFTCFTNYYSEDNNMPYYYDILAYNYGKFFRTSKSPNLSYADIVSDNIMLNTNKLDKNKLDTSVETCIETGFGGLVLLRSNVFSKVSWKFQKPSSVINLRIPPVILCEHWDFCQQVRKLGDILLIKSATATWFQDSIFKNHDIENKIKKLLVNLN